MLMGYVAGPYRANTEWGLVYNIRLAEEWAVYGWEQGCAMICPHKNTANFGGVSGLPDDTWLIGDLEMIKRCDFLLIVPGWERSSGTKGEIALAEEIGIPVFYMPQDMGEFENYLEVTQYNEKKS